VNLAFDNLKSKDQTNIHEPLRRQILLRAFLQIRSFFEGPQGDGPVEVAAVMAECRKAATATSDFQAHASLQPFSLNFQPQAADLLNEVNRWKDFKDDQLVGVTPLLESGAVRRIERDVDGGSMCEASNCNQRRAKR
jgi:hypothetical protein